MSERLNIAVQQAGPVRTETLQGREYRVIPAVMLFEKVLNNNLGATFVPADEIVASVEAWNHIPVVLEHPTKMGQAVSARSPEVLDARGVGMLYRSRWQDGKLKADVFVDMQRLAAVEGGASVVTNINSGELNELSTGFTTQIERSQGSYNNEPYEMVLRDIEPDHLALLSEDLGACSVEEGCGLGANAKEGERPRPFSRALAMLRGLLGQQQEGESDEEYHRRLRHALKEEFGSQEQMWLYIEATYSEEGLLVFETETPEEVKLWRTEFSESEDDGAFTFGTPEEVRREISYVPVAPATAGNPQQEAVTMKREEMIAQLAEEGPLGTDALNKLSTCQLRALHQAAEGGGEGGEGPDPEVDTKAPAAKAEGNEGEGVEGDGTTPEDGQAVQKLLKQLSARVEATNARLDELSNVTKPVAEEQARSRAAVINALKENPRNQLTESEMGGMPTETLQRISASIGGFSYAGRGALGVANAEAGRNGNGADPKFARIRPPHMAAQKDTAAKKEG